jgi:hypothetical protein
MRSGTLWGCILITLTLACGSYALQRRAWQVFQDREDDFILPPDAHEKTEFTFARLRYRNVQATGVWAMRGAWTVDYPKADRQFLQGVRRLSRINARSVEHVVDLISDDLFNYPFVYVVEAGHWDLPLSQAQKLREFLDRGGFVMTDDFHGTLDWSIFTESLNRSMADRPIVDIENSDPIFHVLYDLDDKFQVPGIVNYPFRQTHEYDGFEPKWRALRDQKGRIVLYICHNMDLGDAWEWADHPEYPEKYASLAYRTGINAIIYAMTH